MFSRFFPIQCTAYGLTDAGRSRNHNEDNIRLNQDNSLFIVADGMGGHQAGEIASELAIETIEQTLVDHHKHNNSSNDDVEFSEITAINEAIDKTNLKINQNNIDRGLVDGKGMGSTIVGCWYLAQKKMAIIFHVGDSRAYSYSNKTLTQITKDHSLLQLWKDKCFDGDKPKANVLTKALGPYAEVAPDVSLQPIKKGQKILLCSDGLSTMQNDEQILNTIIKYQRTPEKIPEQLIIEANLAGGEDNISAVLIDFA